MPLLSNNMKCCKQSKKIRKVGVSVWKSMCSHAFWSQLTCSGHTVCLRHCAQELTPVELICVCLLACQFCGSEKEWVLNPYFLCLYCTWIMQPCVKSECSHPVRQAVAFYSCSYYSLVPVEPGNPCTHCSQTHICTYAHVLHSSQTCMHGVMFPVLRARPDLSRLFVCCWKLRAEEATSLRQMHFRGVWPLLGSWKCLQQSERQPEHTSLSIITQQKLVWQPAASNMCKVDHVECMAHSTSILVLCVTPCCSQC